MSDQLEVILIRGGDKSAPEIAAAAGMRYGVRHDYTPYGAVYMLDICWKRYDWAEYMKKVYSYRPVAAMVPDYEYTWQWTSLTRQVRDLQAAGVAHVLVCPKWAAAIAHIPIDCVVALSVPAPSYAGYLPPDLSTLCNRRVHLLGGRPERQAEMIRRLTAVGAKVISVDGNYHVRKAGLGQWFDGGRWVQLRSRVETDSQLAIASSRNIVTYLRGVCGESQFELPFNFSP
jgi:hypothetical protein